MESTASMDASSVSDSECNGVLVQQQRCDNAEESENLDLHFLKDLDSCFEDIEDRLAVSRMVSDSVTRGMICAVEQEAMEKIAQKDFELKKLKETLPLYYAGSDGNESTSSLKYNKAKNKIHDFHLTNSNEIVDHDKLSDSLEDLKFAAKEQFRKLKKEIDKIKGSTSLRRKGSGCNLLQSSGSELLGLSHILPENMPNKWIDVDRALDGLRTTMEYVSENLVCCSKPLLSDWQQEIEFQSEIEGMVIKNCIQCLQEEFEQRLWDHNSQSYGNESTNWIGIINEISSLCQELGVISKLFSVPESGQLLSHGSSEHRNGSGDNFSSPLIREENGNHDELTSGSVPETLENSKLKHLSKEELFNYFKTEMTKMKRQHEFQLYKETEKYFILKRDKDLGSSLPARKDKELDSFRKKIPEVISRLDKILAEIQKLPPFNNYGDSLASMKDRLESLRLENQQLKDLVMDKKEIKRLQLQAFDASEQISEHSLAEETLVRRLKNLECTMEDAQMEASISHDLHTFLLRRVLSQREDLNEELNMEYDMMLAIYANILKEAAENAVTVNNLQTDDSVIESIIMQGICEIVFGESLKEAKEKVGIWNQKYIDEVQVRVSLEMKQLEKENLLKFNIAEREKLEQENVLLREMVDDRAKLLQDVEEELVKEKEKFESASEEIDRLRVESTQQDTLISEYNKKLYVVKNDLAMALEKAEMDRRDISQLCEQLEVLKRNLREADEEKNLLNSISQKYKHDLSSGEARERELMKQLNSTVLLAQELSKTMTDFECRTTEDIKLNFIRLGKLSTQFSSVIQKANRLRKMGLQYKQKLDKRSSDLQKAEVEVDLLGDEVDALLSLLEKIYIALDHYSPILQHYPGVMEILKLVRRELSGKSVKSV